MDNLLLFLFMYNGFNKMLLFHSKFLIFFLMSCSEAILDFWSIKIITPQKLFLPIISILWFLGRIWIWIWILVFNATFSNISTISWRPALLVKEARREPPTMGNQQIICITCGHESSAPFLKFTKLGANPRRISDRLV